MVRDIFSDIKRMPSGFTGAPGTSGGRINYDLGSLVRGRMKLTLRSLVMFLALSIPIGIAYISPVFECFIHFFVISVSFIIQSNYY